MTITIYHHYNCFIVCNIYNATGYFLMPKQLTSMFSSMPRYQFIPVIFPTYYQRKNKTVFPYAFHKLKHVIVVKNIVWMLWKIIKQAKRYFDNMWFFSRSGSPWDVLSRFFFVLS